VYQCPHTRPTFVSVHAILEYVFDRQPWSRRLRRSLKVSFHYQNWISEVGGVRPTMLFHTRLTPKRSQKLEPSLSNTHNRQLIDAFIPHFHRLLDIEYSLEAYTSYLASVDFLFIQLLGTSKVLTESSRLPTSLDTFVPCRIP
jgi:hypothetical protein